MSPVMRPPARLGIQRAHSSTEGREASASKDAFRSRQAGSRREPAERCSPLRARMRSDSSPPAVVLQSPSLRENTLRDALWAEVDAATENRKHEHGPQNLLVAAR